jgi:hypothetical protein
MDFRDTARECENSFSTLCRTARRARQPRGDFFEGRSPLWHWLARLYLDGKLWMMSIKIEIRIPAFQLNEMIP